jgi:hypothetical protein
LAISATDSHSNLLLFFLPQLMVERHTKRFPLLGQSHMLTSPHLLINEHLKILVNFAIPAHIGFEL